MHNISKIVLLISIVFLTSKGYSQVFGGDPSSLKWKQINTPAARIIFPKGLDSVANRITNIISSIKYPTENTIGHNTRKINLVLQNQTTISNGYVNLGPFRSEFLLTPYQNSFDLGSLPWPDQLTIHEYRHVEQYSNFNVGLSKLMHTIFGQEGQALANNAAIPNWFFEGDAVFNETNVSKQGRGSLPAFYNDYRSLWQAGKNYSWMKLRNGSYKDFVPDHYRLGYMLVAYGREKYGNQFWENVTQDAAAYKSFFYPFQHAIKKYTGLDYVTFRNDALDFFKKQFDLEESKNPGSKNDPKKSAYRDERYPSFANDGNIIFVKTTYQHAPELVIRKNNINRKIRQQDYTIDNYFSYRNGKIVYAAYQPDIRWGYRDFSDLRVVNVANGDQQTLKRNTKYFSPDISDDGKKIIAVNEPASGKYDLHLLNAQTGELIAAISNPEKLFYSFPKFYGSDKVVSAVRNVEGKTSLALINLDDGKTEYLLPFTFNVTGFPFIFHDTVYFSYSYKKNDELFAYSFDEKKIWRIQIDNEDGFGKYHPAVNDSDIVWTSFTAEGYRLNFAKKSALKFEQISAGNLQKVTSSFGITTINNTNSNLLEMVSDDSFAIKKYSKSFRLFNFHSIEPAVNDPQYSISLISENILNTLQSEVSFTYDRSEKFRQIGFDATYAGWFPFLSAGVNYLLDRNAFYRGNSVHFNQFQPYAGFNIPLNLSKGRSFTFLNFGSQFVYSQNDFLGKYRDSLKSGSYSFGSNFLSFSHQVQKAQQQIFPSFAQTLNASFKTPFSTYKGYQLVISANVYFPGFLRTHSTLFNFAYLGKDSSGQINFSSGFPFSRGYQSANLYRMYKWGINYQFPFLYPDAGFGNIIYLLRTRANFFYDDTRVRDFYVNQSSFKAKFRSAGAEIYFDTKWWNQASVSFGLRYSYLFDTGLFGETKRNRFEIILPVNIFNQ
ncbi:MAG TPA: hypothetical protein VN726_12415 [Hanamia sp.]|nr:hypothetical protein [Hanamia sp.]